MVTRTRQQVSLGVTSAFQQDSDPQAVLRQPLRITGLPTAVRAVSRGLQKGHFLPRLHAHMALCQGYPPALVPRQVTGYRGLVDETTWEHQSPGHSLCWGPSGRTAPSLPCPEPTVHSSLTVWGPQGPMGASRVSSTQLEWRDAVWATRDSLGGKAGAHSLGTELSREGTKPQTKTSWAGPWERTPPSADAGEATTLHKSQASQGQPIAGGTNFRRLHGTASLS